MLGYTVFVSHEHPDTWASPVDRDRLIASWFIGPGGLRWINALVEAGKATGEGNGYPYSYTALAKDVLPLLKGGPPRHKGPLVIGDDYILPGGWPRNAKINRDVMASCAPDQLIYIHAWDDS